MYLNVGNLTQIIPLLGNCYAYFPYFPVLYMVIAQWLVVMFDFRYSLEKNIEIKYIYGYIGFFLAMSMGFNAQTIFGNFILYFVFPWVLFKINQKISFKISV